MQTQLDNTWEVMKPKANETKAARVEAVRFLRLSPGSLPLAITKTSADLYLVEDQITEQIKKAESVRQIVKDAQFAQAKRHYRH